MLRINQRPITLGVLLSSATGTGNNIKIYKMCTLGHEFFRYYLMRYINIGKKIESSKLCKINFEFIFLSMTDEYFFFNYVIS